MFHDALVPFAERRIIKMKLVKRNDKQNEEEYPEDKAIELVYPLLLLMVYLLLIIGSSDFNLVQQFTVKKAQTIIGIVGGIYFSGILLGIAAIGGLFAYFIVSLKIIKAVSEKILYINVMIICSLFVILYAYAVIIDAHFFSDFEAVSEDLKAVMREEFETETLFLVENESSAAYLDLRFYHDELGVFDCYKIPIYGEFDYLFVPKYLDFELDEEHPYIDNQNQSIELNKVNAQQYQVTYTPNLHIVYKIERIGPYYSHSQNAGD